MIIDAVKFFKQQCSLHTNGKVHSSLGSSKRITITQAKRQN